MNKKSMKFVILSLFFISLNLYAGDVDRGKEKSLACVACHGNEGISVSPIWPKLAGQHAKYTAKQLYEFKKGADGNRNNAVMYGIALTLTDEDISDLSAYYQSLKKSIGVTDDKHLALGQSIYRGGNMEYKIQACIACHGPSGLGNNPAAIPVISGQHADYIFSQLKKFQNDERANDPNKMMRNIVHRMTDEEMKAVAQYIQGLY